MAYTTVGAVKRYLGISESTDDELLSELIAAAAQTAIDGFCRRSFEASADSTRYFHARDDVADSGMVLWLDEDLAQITTVTNGDGVAVGTSEYTTIPRNEVPYYKLRILASSSKAWTYTSDPEDAISIAGRWAYSTTAPDDIVQACTRYTAFMYRAKDAPLTDVTAIEAGTVIRTPGMPADVKSILMPYRKYD